MLLTYLCFKYIRRLTIASLAKLCTAQLSGSGPKHLSKYTGKVKCFNIRSNVKKKKINNY